MKRKILLVSQQQFGYLVDYYKYASYLREKNQVFAVCMDDNVPEIVLDEVKVSLVKHSGNFLYNRYLFFKKVKEVILVEDIDICHVCYQPLISFLFLFVNKKSSKFVLDIRTADVSQNLLKRYLRNRLMSVESLFFPRITVINEYIAKLLKINAKKKHLEIIPLGVEPSSNEKKKNGAEIHLVYVGTFNERRIEDTIKGLKIFLDKYFANPSDKEIIYSIIGSGTSAEEELLKQCITELNLSSVVKLLGYIPNNELSGYLEKATIGISYVPINKQYNYQPPTKTYEYLATGLPIIATRTYANKEIINNQCGVLIKDTPEDFAEGLTYLLQNISKFDSKIIKKQLKGSTWREVCYKLDVYFDNL